MAKRSEEARANMSRAARADGRGEHLVKYQFKAGDGRKRGGTHFDGCKCYCCCPSSRGVNKGFSLDELLTMKQRPRGQRLKKMLIAADIKRDECEMCGQGPVWNDKPLVLQLDHIDGDPTNNSLSNLRIACPNCHSQTLTFGRTRV